MTGQYFATVILPKGTKIPDKDSTREEQKAFIATVNNASIIDFYEADFGELRDIDGRAITIEDVNGNILWEEGSDSLCSRR